MRNASRKASSVRSLPIRISILRCATLTAFRPSQCRRAADQGNAMRAMANRKMDNDLAESRREKVALKE
jgi:hypothetical protein